MKLIFNDSKSRFEAISSYSEKHLSKNAGFSWDSVSKVWFSSSAQSALKLKEYADIAALLKIDEKAKEAYKSIAASVATNSSIEVPAPHFLAYLPYQKAGIEFASCRRNTLIADEMGLGKTIQALGIINLDVTIRRSLIIVPAGLRLNWEKEAGKWLVRHTQILRGGKKELPEFEEGLLILGYEEATKFAGEIVAQKWDLICCDEAHYLKNPKAKRTKAILGIPADRWLLLTGTPVLNRPIELFPLLQKVDPSGLGADWMAYAKRYCAAYKDKWGWKVDGSSNLEELNFKLRTGGMIRREKKDVLKDLPDKRRSLIPLEPNSIAKKLIEEQKKKAIERLKALRKAKALERQNAEVFAEDIKKLKGQAQEIEFTDMARIRHELALTKVEQVSEYTADVLTSEPAVIFAHHTDVIRQIANSLKDAFRVATITGEDETQARQAAVETFQAGNLDCLVCSIKAAGVGLTMTRSSHVIFAEMDWTPGWMQQAEDRCHRIGQKNAVVADWLVLDGSLEAKMAKTLVEKMEVTSAATGAGMTAADVVPVVSVISDEDLSRARENEVSAAKREAEEKAAAEEEARIKATVKEGGYALETADGGVKTFFLKISMKGNFYIKDDRECRATPRGIYRSLDSSAIEEAKAVAKRIASLTASERQAAALRYGKITGHCCHCNQPLSDCLSDFLGIGPDCGRELHARYKENWKQAVEFADLLQEAA